MTIAARLSVQGVPSNQVEIIGNFLTDHYGVVQTGT